LKDLYDKPTSYSSCSTAGANQYRIRTHVVGFSTDTYASGTKDCVDLKTDYPDWDTPLTGTCALATDEDLKVCCTLHELAKAGSNSNTAADSKDSDGEPYIAPDSAALQLALSQIVSGLIRASASGTRPVRSPGVGSAEDRAEMVAFRLLTSYETNTGTSGLYRGNIERLRWKCESGVPVEQPKDLAKGDDFGYLAAKFNSDREFVTYLPSTFTAVDLGKSIRPLLAGGVSDGVTNGATAGARATAVGDAFTDLISEVALNLPLITDPTFPTECPNAANQTQCRDQIMDWHLGYSDNVLPTPNERCASYTNQANCSVIADVLHSTPVIVDKPTAPLEDETYQTFATAWKNRMMMAYVSSNDGFLHGFATSPNDTTDPKVLDDTATNEHFAFVPPLLLPQLKGQYPGANKTFLDGSAIVQDVVATGTNFPYMLEREAGKEGDVGATNATWRTILVQGFGGAQSGYFALDITDTDKPSNGATSGPRFLWQLTTTDANGQPLFGKGGTPTIATINLNNVETAVAILPGGEGGTPSGTTTRRDPQRLNPSSPNTHYKVGVSGGSPPRTDITNYTTGLESRSLTIVRLDSGEILRSFRADPAEVTDLDSSLITGNSGVAPYLDSPITGIPAAFPAGPGMIADRIFVGDKDGTLWRVDVSATDPGDWEMKLFYDAYTGTDGATNGKPIAIAPTLSVNEFGQITVAFGTGDQDLSGGPGDIQYVYSLAEAEDSNAFISKVNWYHRWDSGEHLLGPMSLLAGNLYFSTLDPSGADVCNALGANIYGEDYVLPADIANLGLGGLGRLQPSGSATVYQSQSANGLVAAQGGGGGVSSIFGFSLEFTPSCYVSAPTPLSYLTGSRTAVTNPSSSQLQLVFQTASAAQTTTGALQFQTGFEAINLAPPRQASTVLSWAAILD
jgi:type IV pilus assembly protein PilY1